MATRAVSKNRSFMITVDLLRDLTMESLFQVVVQNLRKILLLTEGHSYGMHLEDAMRRSSTVQTLGPS